MWLVMREKSLTRRSRGRVWRNGAIALALAGTGLGTAFATVGRSKGTEQSPERVLERTIVRQRIAQGLPATPPAQPPAQAQITADQILAAVASYESEMKDLISQVEDLKKKAYASKDIIRLNFLTSKGEEMKNLQSTIQPVIDSIRQPGLDLFVMQAKLSTIRQGLDQLRKAAADAAAAQGDGMDMGISAVDPKNVGAGNNDNDGVSDLPPVGSPSPTDYARPTNASPYK